jgi:hypothetical protein
MSKKKGKAAARSAPKKKKVVRAAASPRRASRTQTSTSANASTSQITIFLFRTSSGNKIRTAPQRAYANPGGRLEWTVVNMIDGSDVPVRLTWPGGSPFGRDSVEFKGRQSEMLEGAKTGRYKYVVHALDAIEDPEIEIPDI